MDKVIGLGKLGCAIAEELSKHPEYRIYKIAPGFEERGSLVIIILTRSVRLPLIRTR